MVIISYKLYLSLISFYVANQVHVAVEDFADWKTVLL